MSTHQPMIYRAISLWQPWALLWERAPKPTIFRNPIAYKGSQGFFAVPGEIVADEVRR